MKQIEVLSEQTLFDLAAQEYGSIEGVWKIMEDNPDLQFDYTARYTDETGEGYPVNENMELSDSSLVDISAPLVPGQLINIDLDFEGIDKNVLKNLQGQIIATGYSEPIIN